MKIIDTPYSIKVETKFIHYNWDTLCAEVTEISDKLNSFTFSIEGVIGREMTVGLLRSLNTACLFVWANKYYLTSDLPSPHVSPDSLQIFLSKLFYTLSVCFIIVKTTFSGCLKVNNCTLCSNNEHKQSFEKKLISPYPLTLLNE